MQTLTIPIRFTKLDKIMLQAQAKKKGVTLSAYIREKALGDNAKLSTVDKLLNLIDDLGITEQEFDEAFEAGAEMRKNFKLTPTV